MNTTSSSQSDRATDVLYYDGQCPLCVKEMDRLHRLKDQHLLLKDIHTLPEAYDDDPDCPQPSKERLLRVLHLQRNGRFITGIDANIAAWQHTRFGLCWRWLGWPFIRPIAEFAYHRWAQWRYQRLY